MVTIKEDSVVHNSERTKEEVMIGRIKVMIGRIGVIGITGTIIEEVEIYTKIKGHQGISIIIEELRRG